MMSLWTNLIAQTVPQAPSPTPGPGAPNSGMAFLLPALMIGMVVFMLLTSRSQKKRERKQREQMMAGMSKNKRVETIGGIIGTIVNVKENEIVLKVDESTNAKMTFVKTAVRRVIDDDTTAVRS